MFVEEKLVFLETQCRVDVHKSLHFTFVVRSGSSLGYFNGFNSFETTGVHYFSYFLVI